MATLNPHNAPTNTLWLAFLYCRGSSGGSEGSQEKVTLKHMIKEPADMPSPDAKPEYFNAICTLANIDPQQSMYYQACSENNRKVSSPWWASVLGLSWCISAYE